MRPRTKWIAAIVGLLGANVVAMVILAVVANNGTNQVIPDYYNKAANYDQEMASSAVSQALGWRVELVMPRGTIDAAVVDRDGKPIEGAEVRITGYQRAHASEPIDIVLSAGKDGRYRAVVAGSPGWYDLVAAVATRGAHYTQHLVVEAQ